jgi:hypothetical protein
LEGLPHHAWSLISLQDARWKFFALGAESLVLSRLDDGMIAAISRVAHHVGETNLNLQSIPL